MSGVSRREFASAGAGALAALASASDLLRPGPSSMPEPTLQALADRADVIETTSRVGIASDLREWEAVRGCFADEVRVDYTSLNGGEPATVRADDLVAGWRGVLPGFDATQHVIANHQVLLDGDRAACRSHFIATHRIGADFWKLGGHYRHELARRAGGWKVTGMTMTWTWEEGSRELVARAVERVKAGD